MINLRWLLVIVFLVGCTNSLSAREVSSNQESRAVPEATPETSRNRVFLRTLDKITARITEFELGIGEELRFGTLAITARYCRTRPPIETPETFAFLEIDDVKRGGTRERVFEGWMVASSPALNALEHAVYDVWVINCKTSAPDAAIEN
ncbi:MAG: DUF2155 domain-containing protein [Kordiimonadaceae bacterium]|nr:DUF2155 domain-containing protein [Kordiimonadaceae bacterium]